MTRAPVPLDQFHPCFERGLALNRIPHDSQLFALALMRDCRERTDNLSSPCGECDRYVDSRDTCPSLGPSTSMDENDDFDDFNEDFAPVPQSGEGYRSTFVFGSQAGICIVLTWALMSVADVVL